jgi:DNA-binding HxlR family transcriptional regulator
MAKPQLKLVEVDYAAEGEANCKALGQILERIGDKWTIMIVGALSRGPMRFNALQKAIPGLSHKMLTVTLRGLERDGLVTRTAFATIPPRVDYELTEQGRSLHQPLLTLASWARSQQGYIEKSRSKFDDRSE